MQLVILEVINSMGKVSGYSIIKETKRISSNQIIFRAGTIYPQIAKLEEEGLLIQDTQDAERAIDTKSVYSLSKLGITELQKRRQHWETLQEIFQSIKSI